MKYAMIGLVTLLFAAGCRHGTSETSARLVGTWEETEEFGNSTPRTPGSAPTIEFRATTYARRYPASGGSPMEGSWHVTSVNGQNAELSFTMRMGGSEMPIDAQRVVFRDANHIELRNALNGHGGVYHRAGTP